MLHLNGENYVIQGESKGFANRQKSIFDQLDAVAVKQVQSDDSDAVIGVKFKKTSTGMECTDEFDDTVDKIKKCDTKHFKGKESIFKKPGMKSPPFKRTIPDFQRNPHKWVKYSLSDVSQDDMSDKSNTAAAMAFLNEVKDRKKNTCEEPMEVDAKITFKKPHQPKSPRIVQVSSEDSPGEDGTKYFRGSKLIMPEYVVGEKKKVRKSGKSDTKSKKDKEIKLNHLTDFDEDDLE